MAAAWEPAEHWSPPEATVLDLWRVELDLEPGDWELLADDERERAGRLLVAEKGRRLARSRAALRRVLARYLETDPAKLVFAYERHGKPRLEGHDELGFNVSHSHRLGLIAVMGAGRVGVDIERCDRERPLDRIAERFFAPQESARYRSLPQADRAAVFYRVWTRKEAYLKAWGTGLSFGSRRFVVSLEETPRLLTTEMPGDRPELWRWADLDLGGDYAGSVCWQGEARSLRCWHLP